VGKEILKGVLQMLKNMTPEEFAQFSAETEAYYRPFFNAIRNGPTPKDKLRALEHQYVDENHRPTLGRCECCECSHYHVTQDFVEWLVKKIPTPEPS
jgi:hypothetical protein